MKLFSLGDIPWKDTQLVYHALAYEGVESLVLSSPEGTGMCLGLHQHPHDELDLDYCTTNDIGVFRREIGGGTVLLNGDLIFYNLILRRDTDGVPRIPQAFFEKYLEPVVGALGDLGVHARYRPMCDLLVRDRKISGNGGGEVGECMVMTGDLMLDFDYETMANALKLTEKMRSSFLGKMKENLTTLETELGGMPSKSEVVQSLTRRYEEFLGPLEVSNLDRRIEARMRELEIKHSSETWLLQRGARQVGREVKVREGVYLFSREYSTPSGSMTVDVETAENSIIRVKVTGSGETTRYTVGDALLGLGYEKAAVDELVLECIGGEANGGD